MLLVEGNGHDDRGECASAIANWNCPLEGGRTVPLSCHPLSACKCMYICKICQLMSQAASSIYIIGFTHAGTPKVRDDISRHMPSGSALPRTVRPASLDYGCSGDFLGPAHAQHACHYVEQRCGKHMRACTMLQCEGPIHMQWEQVRIVHSLMW